MKTTPKIPEIRQEELTPLVTALVEIIRIQHAQIQELRDEIAKLKGQKPKLKIKNLDPLNDLTDAHPESS
jgi:hypothetical protein